MNKIQWDYCWYWNSLKRESLEVKVVITSSYLHQTKDYPHTPKNTQIVTDLKETRLKIIFFFKSQFHLKFENLAQQISVSINNNDFLNLNLDLNTWNILSPRQDNILIYKKMSSTGWTILRIVISIFGI